MLKLTEFQSVKSSGYITVPFSISWSHDNFLAFVTDKGVNVVELRFSGLSKEGFISVKRWFIKPRQVVPTSNCMINVAKLSETLSLEELFKVTLDRTLSPRASLNGVTANVLSVSWAPFCHHLCQTSLLTVLTDQGSLDIYNHEESDWVLLVSISEKWLNICSKKWNNNELTDVSSSGLISELKRRAYRVKISSFSWGKSHEDKWFSLFTANLMGEIMLWKVEISASGVDVVNLLVHKTDLDSNCSLHCLSIGEESFMVLSGCTNGKIQCFTIENNAVKAKSIVWSDMDQLPIPINGPVGTICPEGILYVVPKLSHLLFFWLDTDALLINFSTYSTDDINISGIVWLKDNEFMVSTRNGSVLFVTINLSSNCLDVIVEKGEPLVKINSPYSFHGIVTSKNRCIFAASHSVCSAHDPSVIKEPSTVTLYSKFDSIDPEALVKKSSTTSLYEIWDFLELIRLECIRKTEVIQLRNESMENCSLMDIAQLKNVYWLKKFSMNVMESSKLEIHEELKLLCCELKRAIITYYLFSRVDSLYKKFELSTNDLESLTCAKIWLKQYCADGKFKTYKKKAEILLRNYIHSMNIKDEEKCPLCDSECGPIDSDLVMSCPLGHKVSRCPRTLLPIISPPYFTCTYCGETSTYGSDDYRICILCDAPLRFKESLLR